MQPDQKEIYRQAPPDRGASSFIYPPTEANIRFFASVLKRGGVVGIPTETVYGLAGLALNETACRSIFEIKGRPLMDPLIVHAANLQMVRELAEVPPLAERINENFWPGPLTLILRKKPVVPDLVTAGKKTVAVRIPGHPVARSLIGELGEPLAAPSANPFGYISPSTPQHVASSFGAKLPFIIDGGPCEIGLESTILDLTPDDHVEILRPGAVSLEVLQTTLGIPVVQKQVFISCNEAATAPGTMHRHYSPVTQLVLFAEAPAGNVQASDAVVYLKRPDTAIQTNVFWLSDEGDSNEIAKSLYSMLRTLDAKGFDRIHFQQPGANASGVLTAVRDRLLRAASSK
jgi:L-threonylcarbamoyladenylate synthase